MTKALELAKFGRESPPAGTVVGDSDTQTLSSKTFSDGPVFSSGTVNSVPYLNASKVFSTSATFVFDGTNLGIGVASPGYMLHVKGGALAATSADGTVTSTFNYNSLGTVTNSDFVFNTNSIERARISSTGLAVTGALTSTGQLTNNRAAGLDSYINHVTTGINNTVMGFNNSGSTNSSGVLNNTAYLGSLNTYSTAVVGNGAVIATFQASSVGSQGIYVNGVVGIAQSSVFPTVGFTYNSNGYLYTLAGTSGHITQINSVNVITTTSTGLGIGSGVTPSYKLHAVRTSGGIVGRFDTTTDGITDIYGYGLEITRSDAYIKSTGSLSLGGAAGYSGIVISGAGNVGIGAAPTAVTGFGINKFLEIAGASVPGLVLRPTGSTSEYSVLGAGDGLLIGAAGAATATNNVIRLFTSNVNSSNSPTERLRIESNGTIKKLGTNGGLQLMDGNTAGGVKIGSYTSNFLGDGYLAFEGYSIEYGRFDSAGNFMVGATSTSAIANRNIDVNGTGDASFNIRVGGTTRAYFYSTAGQTLLGTNTNIPITFYPNNIERMRIAVDGAVTIGNAIAATNVVLNLNGVANKAKRIVFQDSGVEQWLMGSGAASENDAFEIYNANGQMALSFAKASSNATFVGSVITSRLNVTNNSTYAIEVYGTGLTQDAPSGNNDHIATARVRIGYMRGTNIGTIASNGGDSGLSLITHSSSTGWKESVRIQPSGNVGIGTTDPSKPLQIKTNASAAGTYYLATIGGSNHLSGYAVGLGFDPEGYGYRNKIAIIAEGNNQGYSRGKLHIAFNALNNSTEAGISDSKVTFLENGFVGIGLDGGDPEAKLHVKMFRSSSTSGIALLLADNVTGGQTNNVYKAIRSASNSGSSVSEIRFVETDGTNNNTAIAFATAHTAGGLSEKARVGPDGQFMVGTTVGNASSGGIHATGSILQGEAGLYQQQIAISGGNTIQSLNLGVGYTDLRLNPLGGNVLVNTISTVDTNGAALVINASYPKTRMEIRNDGEANGLYAITFRNVNGMVGNITTGGSTTTYNTSSDYRLKNITGSLTGYKQRLMALQPKQGTWISDSSEFRGFLAHEFANQYPKSVTGEKDAVDSNGNPVTQGMQASSSEVMADLIAMVQDLITENESFKARLSAANL